MKFKLLFVLGFIYLFLSCATKKKIVKTLKTEVKSAIELSRDSVVSIEKSLPINDNIFISLKTNDVLVDSLIHARLKGFITTKKSGYNSVKVKYDTFKKGVEIITTNKGSESKEIQSSRETATENHTKEVRQEERTQTTGLGWRFYIVSALVIMVLFVLLWFLKKIDSEFKK